MAKPLYFGHAESVLIGCPISNALQKSICDAPIPAKFEIAEHQGLKFVTPLKESNRNLTSAIIITKMEFFSERICSARG